MYGDMRHVFQCETLPGVTSFKGNKEPQFRACIEQLRVPGVFLDHLQIGLIRQIATDVDEGLTAVGSLENIRLEVVEHVAVDAYIGAQRGARRSLHMRNHRCGGDPEFCRNVRPGAATIQRHLHVAVVGTCPENACFDG